MIIDSTRAECEGFSPTEESTRKKLDEILTKEYREGQVVFVTTFASHVNRINVIQDICNKLNKKLIIMGRSMEKYLRLAEKLDLFHPDNNTTVIPFKRLIKKFFNSLKNPEDYVFLVTGHQGEDGSIIREIAEDKLRVPFSNYSVVFSSLVIPTKTNIDNRELVESMLKDKKIPFYREVHSSGHAYKEDIKELIELFEPKKIIPSHGELEKRKAVFEIAKELKYNDDNVILILQINSKI
jgi:ribonuclease J